MLRAFEQESSGRYAMPDTRDARSEGSSVLAYAPPVSTARPRPARRSFALRSWFDVLGRSRRLAAAGLAFALILAIYWRFANAHAPAMVAGHAPLSAPAAQPLQSTVARSAVAAAPRPASSAAQSQPLKRPPKVHRATSKRWLPLPAAKLEAGARDTPASAHGVVMLSSTLGWADIYEGSKRLGTTPLRVQLSSGLHRLSVRPYGEGPRRIMTIALRPAQTVKLDIALQW